MVTLCISLIIIVASYILKVRVRLIPGGFQNIVESVLEALLNLADSVTQDRKQIKKFFPLVATIFIFVILSNWVEVVPGLGTIGLRETHEGKNILVPFLRSGSADLNFTLALAIVSVMSAQILGIAAIGIGKYAGKFFVSPFRPPYFVGTFVGILELISEVAKLISFSFRLVRKYFRRRSASDGDAVSGSVFRASAVFVSGTLRRIRAGLVFSMLTLVFFKMAATEAALGISIVNFKFQTISNNQ